MQTDPKSISDVITSHGQFMIVAQVTRIVRDGQARDQCINMEQQDEMMYEDQMRRTWGTIPTFYWIEEAPKSVMAKTVFKLRVIQRPIQSDMGRYFAASSLAADRTLPKFGGIIWADSMQAVYNNRQLWNYLLEHQDFHGDEGLSDLTNVQHILEQIRKETKTDVVLVIYDATVLQLQHRTSVLDLHSQLPMTYGFFMLWLYQQGKEYFTSTSALRFSQYTHPHSLRWALTSPIDQLLSKL